MDWNQGLCRLVQAGLYVLLLALVPPSVCHRHLRHKEPEFLPSKQNITVSPGERSVLRCIVDHLGTKTVVWRREGEPHPLTVGLYVYYYDTRMNIDFNQRNKEWSLIIQDTKPTDEGTYICQINTKKQNKKYEVNLYVKTPTYPQVTAVQVKGPEFIDLNKPIHLICNATGKPYPPSDLDWYKDGEKIKSNSETGILITKKIESKVLISVLVIKHSKRTDSGDYYCRASDGQTAYKKVQVFNVAKPNKRRSHKQGPKASQSKVEDNSTSLRGNSLCTVFASMVSILTVLLLTRWRTL